MRQLTWTVFAAWGMVLAVSAVSRAEEGEEHETHIKIPKAVAKSLKAKFPEAEIRGISREKNEKGKTTYEFSLVIHTKVDVEFEENGELEAVERQIGVFELPEGIRQAAAKRGKIVKAETITQDEGELKYELLVQAEGKTTELVYSPSGKLLKTEAQAGEKEDEHAKRHEGDKRGKAKGQERQEAHEKGKLKKHKHEEEDEDEKPKAKHREESEHKGKAKRQEESEEHEKGKVKRHDKEQEEEDDDEEHERSKSK